MLARIDPLEYEIALHRAQANLAQAKAQEGEGGRPIDQARAQVTQLRRRSSQAEARTGPHRRATGHCRQNLGRNNRLYSADTRAIAKADVDQTKSTFDATQASRERHEGQPGRRALQRHRRRSAGRAAPKRKLAAAQATVAANEAAVRDAERELSYAALTAPVDGRIGNKNIETGNRVQVGQALFALVQSDLWVLANFKETQLAHMQAGQPVEMTIDAVGWSRGLPAGWTASHRPRARSSRCCRRTMRRAISPRSCSACR